MGAGLTIVDALRAAQEGLPRRKLSKKEKKRRKREREAIARREAQDAQEAGDVGDAGLFYVPVLLELRVLSSEVPLAMERAEQVLRELLTTKKWPTDVEPTEPQFGHPRRRAIYSA